MQGAYLADGNEATRQEYKLNVKMAFRAAAGEALERHG